MSYLWLWIRKFYFFCRIFRKSITPAALKLPTFPMHILESLFEKQHFAGIIVCQYFFSSMTFSISPLVSMFQTILSNLTMIIWMMNFLMNLSLKVSYLSKNSWVCEFDDKIAHEWEMWFKCDLFLMKQMMIGWKIELSIASKCYHYSFVGFVGSSRLHSLHSRWSGKETAENTRGKNTTIEIFDCTAIWWYYLCRN